jgi:AraC-like DNA-binding protein
MTVVVTYVFLSVGVAMVVFAALQLTVRKRNLVNLSLAALFFFLGYIWLYYGFYRQDRLAAAPWLLYSDVPFTYLVGPFLYMYARNLVGKPRVPAARRLLRFAPGVAVMAYMALLRPYAGIDASRLPGPNPDHFLVPAVSIINTAGDLYFFCFVAASTFLVAEAYRAGSPLFRCRFRGVLIYFTNASLTFILFFAGHVLSSDNLLGVAVLANGINSVYFFFLSYRNPEYTQRMLPTAPDEGGAQSASIGSDVRKALSELRVAMDVEKLFMDPALSLQSLSIRLRVPSHRLSQILNENLGINFRSYVNKRRIDEAKRMLLEKPDDSILDIAFAVGFNSKSSFNTAFAKETGLTPRALRKSRLTSEIPNFGRHRP